MKNGGNENNKLLRFVSRLCELFSNVLLVLVSATRNYNVDIYVRCKTGDCHSPTGYNS